MSEVAAACTLGVDDGRNGLVPVTPVPAIRRDRRGRVYSAAAYKTRLAASSTDMT